MSKFVPGVYNNKRDGVKVVAIARAYNLINRGEYVIVYRDLAGESWWVDTKQGFEADHELIQTFEPMPYIPPVGDASDKGKGE